MQQDVIWRQGSSPSPDDGGYSGKSLFICSAGGCDRPSDSGMMVILSDDSGNGWDDGSNIGRDR